MKIGIIGSRKLKLNPLEIMERLKGFEVSEIISGGAKGIDTTARMVAKILNVPCREFKPEYFKYGRIAPFIRNEKIIETSDVIFAFWNGNSTGTENALNIARRKNKPFKIFLYSRQKTLF